MTDRAELERLCSRYDGFLLDLWGVVMDGVHTFPGALAWLARRRVERKPVWFLSNASRTMEATTLLLANLGITADFYAGVTTSGQLAMDALTAPGPLVKGAIYIAGEIPELAQAEDVTLVDLDSGHWPMLTRPVDLADLLADAARP